MIVKICTGLKIFIKRNCLFQGPKYGAKPIEPPPTEYWGLLRIVHFLKTGVLDCAPCGNCDWACWCCCIKDSAAFKHFLIEAHPAAGTLDLKLYSRFTYAYWIFHTYLQVFKQISVVGIHHQTWTWLKLEPNVQASLVTLVEEGI